ncbi:EAL domain-containing protein [Methylobacterium mesophilicum SR1.6/6]|uniref:EAL domain-containing protein n=1 Tax=Methylobacterium mesophilicum SR1.6/6 TaxID=908290 RepID=A0A6B9FI45_9HYPH|nr:EAL domain-containing protein [Methylobacterium mesophilicum SR1.6/6]
MALRPIRDLTEGSVRANETLGRGLNGAPAGTILDRVTDANRYQFVQAARGKASARAGRHAIVAGVVLTARALGETVLAEGIETAAELDALRGLGITLP